MPFFLHGPLTGSGTGIRCPLEAALRVQGAGGLGTLCGIQGVELFFGDGGVLVVGGDGFVYVVFGPELAVVTVSVDDVPLLLTAVQLPLEVVR